MLEQACIIGFMVFAIYYTMLDGEIFGALGTFFYRHLPNAFHQPVYYCPICMVPWYGSAIYWIVWHHDVKDWIVSVITAMGINFILNSIRGHGDDGPTIS